MFGYVGKRPNDLYEGYIHGLRNLGLDLTTYAGRMEGGDLRWNSPVKNLLARVSYLVESVVARGTDATNGGPYSEKSKADETSQYYVQYAIGGLRVDGEYRRYLLDQLLFNASPHVPQRLLTIAAASMVQPLTRSLSDGNLGRIIPASTRAPTLT